MELTPRRILFVANRFPHPAHRGDNRRALGLLSELVRHAPVTLVCFGEPPEATIDGVRTVTVGHQVGTRRVLGRDGLHALTGNLRSQTQAFPLYGTERQPFQVRARRDLRMLRAVNDLVRTEQPDVIHLYYSTMGPYMPAARSKHVNHIDLVDPMSRVTRTQAQSVPQPLRWALEAEAERMRTFEARLVQESDSSSLVSDVDRETDPVFRSTWVIPNGVDTTEFPYRSPAERAQDLIFFGNLGYPSNAEAAERLAERVLPLIRMRIPAARLRLVGADAGRKVKRLGERDGVIHVGQVSRVVTELHKCSAALVPLYSGAGMRNKILEAFSAGIPVVSNVEGARGLAITPGVTSLSGESDAELAHEAVRLLESPALRCSLAAEARQLVQDDYTWSRQTKRLLTAYGVGLAALRRSRGGSSCRSRQ